MNPVTVVTSVVERKSAVQPLTAVSSPIATTSPEKIPALTQQNVNEREGRHTENHDAFFSTEEFYEARAPPSGRANGHRHTEAVSVRPPGACAASDTPLTPNSHS